MSSIGSGGLNPWQTSLVQAAGKGDDNGVRELVQEGMTQGDRFLPTLKIALQKVAGRGNEPLTRFLLERGAGVDAAPGTEIAPLYRAAETGRDRIVKVCSSMEPVLTRGTRLEGLQYSLPRKRIIVTHWLCC